MTDKPADRPGSKSEMPRKPKATFGDVMKGIPAGRPGEEPRRDRKDDRKGGDKPGGRDRPPRDSNRPPQQARPAAPAADGAAPAAGAEGQPARPAQDRGPRQDRGPGGQDRGGPRPARPPRNDKPKGPEVTVVRKAGAGAPSQSSAAVGPTPAGSSATTAAPAAAPAAPAEANEQSASPKPAAPSLVYSRPLEEQHEPEGESFADLMKKADHSRPATSALRPGTKVTGVIIQLGPEMAFLTLKEGGEAHIERREIETEGQPEAKVGDFVEAFVVSIRGGGRDVQVSKGMAKTGASVGRLEVARLGGLPVDGTVTGVNKGGFEVELGGGVRAFCPISQIDTRFVDKPETFIGQKLQFKVAEMRGDDVVLSRRALLEDERKGQAEKIRAQLVVGAKLKGKVTSIRDFGAFVDLGGVEGLIHVSELSHARVGHPSEILQPNQEVEVEVTKIDAGDPKSPDKNKQKERIGLSLRALEADPWANLEERFPIGSHLKAKVVRLQPFGAFVALAPGVDGLIHISNLSDKRISHPKDVVAEGQEIEVVVEKLEPENRKIGLALWREGYTAPAVAAPLTDAPSAPKPQPIKRAQVGDVVEATVDKVEPFGLFISFPSGRGLVPNVEMGTPFGTDHKKMFPPGSTFKAIVLEIDQQGRLRLSKAGVERAEERAEVSKWQAENAPKGSGKSGFGTLGDLLKAKLNK